MPLNRNHQSTLDLEPQVHGDDDARDARLRALMGAALRTPWMQDGMIAEPCDADKAAFVDAFVASSRPRTHDAMR